MEPPEVWRDDTRHFPELELPSSSLDLLIPPGPLLLEALSVYETLRYFTQARFHKHLSIPFYLRHFSFK